MPLVSAKAADRAGINLVLNSSGPRSWAAQADAMGSCINKRSAADTPNLTLFQQGCDDLIVENDRVCGVVTQMGLRFHAKNVVLTVGTFLGGQIHIGLDNYQGGRAGDPPANALAKRLRALPLRVERLKTGTPPRIASSSVDFSVMQEQPGDNPTPVFSYMGSRAAHPRQISCYITHTNERHTTYSLRA